MAGCLADASLLGFACRVVRSRKVDRPRRFGFASTFLRYARWRRSISECGTASIKPRLTEIHVKITDTVYPLRVFECDLHERLKILNICKWTRDSRPFSDIDLGECICLRRGVQFVKSREVCRFKVEDKPIDLRILFFWSRGEIPRRLDRDSRDT